MDERTAAILSVLKDLTPIEATVPVRSPRGRFERRFKGPLLFDYATAAGLLPAPGTGPIQGSYYFLFTAEDGVRVTVAFAEVSPRFTDKQVLLAYEQDGEPLNVGVRLVVPGDDLGGRSISGVASIELRDVESSTPHAKREPSVSFSMSGLIDRPATFELA